MNMKKHITLVFALVITMLAAMPGAFAQQPVTLDQALENAATSIRNQLVGRHGARIAVTRIDAGTDALANFVTNGLSDRLVATGHFTVLGRGGTLAGLWDEIDHQLDGLVSDNTIVSLTAQLGAELVVVGSITPLGISHRMDVRVLNVETTQVLAQFSAPAIRIDGFADNRVQAAVIFEGASLDIFDRNSLTQDLRRTLQAQNIPVDLVDDPGAAFNFLISLRTTQRERLMTADMTIAFRQGNRVLQQSARHNFGALSMEEAVRLGGGRMAGDTAFFQTLPGILAQQF